MRLLILLGCFAFSYSLPNTLEGIRIRDSQYSSSHGDTYGENKNNQDLKLSVLIIGRKTQNQPSTQSMVYGLKGSNANTPKFDNANHDPLPKIVEPSFQKKHDFESKQHDPSTQRPKYHLNRQNVHGEYEERFADHHDQSIHTQHDFQRAPTGTNNHRVGHDDGEGRRNGTDLYEQSVNQQTHDLKHEKDLKPIRNHVASQHNLEDGHKQKEPGQDKPASSNKPKKCQGIRVNFDGSYDVYYTKGNGRQTGLLGSPSLLESELL